VGGLVDEIGMDWKKKKKVVIYRTVKVETFAETPKKINAG